MENTSNELSDKQDNKRKINDKDKHNEKHKIGNVCRDFLRNVCDRGTACKFEHPPDQKQGFLFCHDFQHGYCRRSSSCKFIHGSHRDESHYLKTGQLLPHLLGWCEQQCRNSPGDIGVPYCKKFFDSECWSEDNSLKHPSQSEYSSLEEQTSATINGRDENVFERHILQYCKQYMWGECWDENCRFQHITRNEYRKIEERSPTPPDNRSNESNLFERRGGNPFEDGNKFGSDCYEPDIKRPYIVENDRINNMNVNEFENMSYHNGTQSDQSYIMLEKENMMLRGTITELKKRIDDLQVTNEFLLEQNARLRLQQDKNTTRLTTMTVPAVTITNMTVPAVTITNSVPAANQIQQNPTPQQMVTAALRTVTASVATVPVSISTVTPVSISAVSMAPVQQMQGSVMTIAQQNAPSVPLISYRLMSRTVVQQPAPPNLTH